MQPSTRFTIAVFGQSDTVTADILSSWFNASVSLEGPLAAAPLSGNHSWVFSAAIIDVRSAPDIMLPLMDVLDAEAIPFVFFVPGHLIGIEAGPFVLSSKPEDIADILDALATQRPVIRH